MIHTNLLLQIDKLFRMRLKIFIVVFTIFFVCNSSTKDSVLNCWDGYGTDPENWNIERCFGPDGSMCRLIIFRKPLFYSSDKIRNTQNEHLSIVFQNLNCL